MPPKIKFSQEDIVNAAFCVIRENGMGALSTRKIAKKINASTMPIYSYMRSKKNLEDKIMDKCIDLLSTYQFKKRTGDLFVDLGVGFVLFAKHEKNLFRFIYDERNVQAHSEHIQQNIEQRVGVLRGHPTMKGLDDEEIRVFMMEGFTYSFGLAHLVNNGWYSDFEDKQLIQLVWESGKTHLAGFEALRNTDSKIQRV